MADFFLSDFFLSDLKSTLDNCITELDEIHYILSTSAQREIGISCIGLHKSRHHYTAL